MAQQRVGNLLGVAARNASASGQLTDMNGSTTAGGEHPVTNMDSITSMRTRLAAINGTTYTSTVLDLMTYNDMVYAIRLNDNGGTI